MKPFIKLIKPDLSEIIAYCTAATIILLVENLKRIKLLLDSSAGTSTTGDPKYQTFLTYLSNGIEDKLDPRLIDFLVWILVGCLAFVVISGITAFYKTTGNEVELLHFYRSPKNYAHQTIITLTKAAIRISAVIFIVIWLIYLVGNINDYLANSFFTAVSSLGSATAWLWLPLIIVSFAACIYVLAIAIRLIALRIRIFSEEDI